MEIQQQLPVTTLARSVDASTNVPPPAVYPMANYASFASIVTALAICAALLVLKVSTGDREFPARRIRSKDEFATVNNLFEAGGQESANSHLQQMNDSSGLKTLVVVTGSLRGGEKAWQTLYDNVLEVNHADLAVITEDPVPERYRNASLFDRAKYVWMVPKYDDWADAMDLIHNSSAWREPLMALYTGKENIMLGGMGNIRASGAIIFMFRWFLSQRIRENNLIQIYDRFVVTRSDHYYLCPHDLSTLDPSMLWVPSGQDFRGVCDRHFVCGNHDILTALDILPPLLLHSEKYYKQLTHPRYNSERFLLHRWAEEGLKIRLRRFNRTMFVSATQQDSSRWSVISQFPVKEGVYIKYPEEYAEALQGCFAE